jgi:hypothetical protein
MNALSALLCKEHWTEFLGESTNIWKAAQYFDPGKRSSFGRITSIKGQGGEVIQDKARIATELLHSFFPNHLFPRGRSVQETLLQTRSLAKD